MPLPIIPIPTNPEVTIFVVWSFRCSEGHYLVSRADKCIGEENWTTFRTALTPCTCSQPNEFVSVYMKHASGRHLIQQVSTSVSG